METEYKGRTVIIYRLCDGSQVRADEKTSPLQLRDEVTGLLTNISGKIAVGTPVVYTDPKTRRMIDTLVEGFYPVTEPIECTDIRDK